MKAENVDVLVRDLIEAIGVPNRSGVPLHLLIAEAKAFAKQKSEDQGRYVEKLEKDVETLIKSESDALAKVKDALDRLTLAKDDARMFQIQIRDLMERLHVEYPEDDRKIGMDEVRALFKKLDESLDRGDQVEEANKISSAAAVHGHMMWGAEKVSLEQQVEYWKSCCADLVSAHAMKEGLFAAGQELDFINTIRRRRDSLPKGAERDRLHRIVAPFEQRDRERG